MNSHEQPTLSTNRDPSFEPTGPPNTVQKKNAYTYVGKISSLTSRIEKPLFPTRCGTKNGSDGLNQKRKQNARKGERRRTSCSFSRHDDEEEHTTTHAFVAAQITNNPVSKSPPPPPLLHVKSVCVAKIGTPGENVFAR